MPLTHEVGNKGHKRQWPGLPFSESGGDPNQLHPVRGDTMDKVCGSGAQCENTCPVMLMGRICPDLPTFLEEVRCLMTESSEEAPQIVPQLA